MIQHTGKIVQISGNVAEVSIERTSACAGCHAKNVCMPGDKKEQKINATVIPDYFTEGEEVNILLKTGNGYKALMFAYLFPVLFVVLTLVVSNLSKIEEWKGAILALIVVSLYFLILKYFSVKLSQSIEFKVEKINNE